MGRRSPRPLRIGWSNWDANQLPSLLANTAFSLSALPITELGIDAEAMADAFVAERASRHGARSAPITETRWTALPSSWRGTTSSLTA